MVLRSSGRPYASVYLAVFEPLILDWIGDRSITTMLDPVLHRPTRAPGASAPGEDSTPPRNLRRAVGFARMVVRPAAAEQEIDPDDLARRRKVIEAFLTDSRPDLAGLRAALGELNVPPLANEDELRLILSPIGVMHRYRQLYFDAGAGIGPIEHAFGIAPREELVVVQETSRREAVETTEQFGTESTLEKSAEQVAVEEISDHVQTALLRDMSVAVSGSAGGSIGIFGGSVSSSLGLAQSSERAREHATMRSTTQTTRSSETIRKTYSLSVRSSSEITERSSTRRTVRNDADAPVNYGLRRVLRSVKVKLQSLGPQLVWQTYVTNPGARLGGGRFVTFHETSLVGAAVPGAPPRPENGEENGTQTVAVEYGDAVGHPEITGAHKAIRIAIPDHPDRQYTGIVIEAIDGPDGDGTPGVSRLAAVEQAGGATVFVVEVRAGGTWTVTVSYSAQFIPSEAALTRWREQVTAAQQQYSAAREKEAFDRAERLITARSKIRPRPAADLRDEERYELLGRLIAELFPGVGASGLPGPVEVELLHRYLDVPGIFYFVHPAWWRPRYGASRRDYEITGDAEPARFGSSLGWMLQLDGDRRRNELLNSPWVRVGLPIRAGVEREAISWLAEYFEGRRGFRLDGRVGALIGEVEARRSEERLALPGPDYVTTSGEVPPSLEQVAETYPVIDELELGMPTEGFVYERLEVEG